MLVSPPATAKPTGAGIPTFLMHRFTIDDTTGIKKSTWPEYRVSPRKCMATKHALPQSPKPPAIKKQSLR